MGRTVPSYRIALEDEISRWKNFSRVLRSEEKTGFEQLMDACRNYTSAAGNAANPIIFEPMALSIMLHQQLQLNKQQKEIDKLKQKLNADE